MNDHNTSPLKVPAKAEIPLSIVIVNWMTKDALHACLSSILSHAPDFEYEIIVIDNASTDGSSELVQQLFPSVKLISLEKNVGYAKGNNIGIIQSKGEFILTLNPDTEFFDDSLSKAVQIMQINNDISALSGRLLNKDGTTQYSMRGFPKFSSILFDWIGLSRLFPNSKVFGAYRMKWFDYDKQQDAQQPMGTFLLYRRSALLKTGIFDEQFPIFFNEVDLLMRFKKNGFRVVYSPDVKLYHIGGESTKQKRKQMVWESHYSFMRFYKKWYLKGWKIILIPLISFAVYIFAFLRTRSFSRGFRVEHNDL